MNKPVESVGLHRMVLSTKTIRGPWWVGSTMSFEWIAHFGKISINRVEPLPRFALRCVLSDRRSLPKHGRIVLSGDPTLLAGSVGLLIVHDCSCLSTPYELTSLDWDDSSHHLWKNLFSTTGRLKESRQLTL